MDSVVVFADGECPQVCAMRGVTEYHLCGPRHRLGFTGGALVPDGGRGRRTGYGAVDDPSYDGRTTGAPEGGRDTRPVYDALVSGRRIG